MVDKLTQPLQESLITLLCTNSEHGKIAAGIVDTELFEPPLDDIASRAVKYIRQFGEAPGVAHLDDLFDHVLGNPEHKKHRIYQSVLGGILEQAKGLNAPYVLSRVNEFMRSQNLKAAVIEAGERYQQGGTNLITDVEGILHKALKFNPEPMDTGTFLGDRRRILGYLNNEAQATYKLHIPELDRRQIGPTAGELLGFMAPKGRGKCLGPDELVLLADGRQKRIEDVVRDKDKHIIAFDEQNKKLVPATISHHIDSGRQPIFQIKTKLGYTIKCSGQHPFWTESGWKKTIDLGSGDRIAVVVRYGDFIPLESQHLRPINDELFFDPVVEIIPLGESQTYDISVPEYHSFVANGIVAHNTWFCIHTGVACLMQGARVVHVTLEMRDERIMPRYLQNLYAIAKRPDKVNIPEFMFDELERISGFDIKKVKPPLNFQDPRIDAKITRRMSGSEMRLNRLVVKSFPTGELTLDALESYLDNLEITAKFTPTVIIIDYPDLMRIPGSLDNYRHSLGELYKQIRGMVSRRNLSGIIPIQSNREGESVKLITARQTGEDYSKTQTLDMLITYNQTEREHDLKLARLYVDKARNDEDKFTLLIAQNYDMGQFCIQSAFMPKRHWDFVKKALGEEDDDAS